MPPEIREIKLKLKGNGELNIPHNHVKKADKTDFIVWRLKKESGIDSFEIVIQSGGEIFKTLPHGNGNVWTAEIDQNARDYAQCKYDIVFLPRGSTTSKVSDPIIAIKPTASFNAKILLYVTGGIIIGALSFWGISSLRRR